MASPHAGPPAVGDLLAGYSLEITVRDVDRLREARAKIADRTPVSVTFLPGDAAEAVGEAAAAVRAMGLLAVPHIPARRLRSAGELDALLARLAMAGVDRAFIIAGDAERPLGPYGDALAVIATGRLGAHGVRHVGIGAYPEGHPHIPQERLWPALKDKLALLADLGHEAEITTQFGFAAAPVLDWLERLRGEGVEAPVRVGLPGPASVKTLLRFAARCGVGASAKVMSRYGLSMTRLLNTTGPDALIEDLAIGLDPAVHGRVRVHLYPFGGVKAAAAWADHARQPAMA